LLLNGSEAWRTLQSMRLIKREGFSPNGAPGNVVESSSSLLSPPLFPKVTKL